MFSFKKTCEKRPPPSIRGRREHTCRICGYSVSPTNGATVRFACCSTLAHPLCWRNASEQYRLRKGSPRRPRCSMLSSYLTKGGSDLLDNQLVISSQRPATPPRPVTIPRASCSLPVTAAPPSADNGGALCPFCGVMLSLNENLHALTEYTKLNELFDPGGALDDGAFNTLTPLATRCAAMSRVDSMEGTPFVGECS